MVASARRVVIEYDEWDTDERRLVRRRLVPGEDRLELFSERSTGHLAWVNNKRLQPGERIYRNGDELLHVEPALDNPVRIPDDIAEETRERLKA